MWLRISDLSDFMVSLFKYSNVSKRNTMIHLQGKRVLGKLVKYIDKLKNKPF